MNLYIYLFIYLAIIIRIKYLPNFYGTLFHKLTLLEQDWFLYKVTSHYHCVNLASFPMFFFLFISFLVTAVNLKIVVADACSLRGSKLNGNIADPNNPHQLICCLNGKAVGRLSCPDGLNCNEKKDGCLYKVVGFCQACWPLR